LLTISQFSQAIYNGAIDQRNGWSSVVNIGQNSNTYCSGVVISATEVLTVATCLPYIGRSVVRFGIGGTFVWSNIIAIASAKVYSQYDPSENFNIDDFLLITLKEPIANTVEIVPILSADEGKKFFKQNNQTITLVGYGVETNGFSGIKRYTKTKITNTYDREFEAGINDGHGPCSGDSGGAAMAVYEGSMKVVGIFSRGIQSNDKCLTYGSLFGRVDSLDFSLF
jgi:hypothetical protein